MFRLLENKAFNPLTKALTTYFEYNLMCSPSYVLISVHEQQRCPSCDEKETEIEGKNRAKGGQKKKKNTGEECLGSYKLRHIMQIRRVIAIKLSDNGRARSRIKRKIKRNKYKFHTENIMRCEINSRTPTMTNRGKKRSAKQKNKTKHARKKKRLDKMKNGANEHQRVQ